MSSRKTLSQTELETIAQRMFDEPESEDENIASSDSELSDEHVDADDYDGATEESVSDEDEPEEEETCVDDRFYVAKDGRTKWRKWSYENFAETKTSNVPNEPCGLKPRAKDVSDEFGAFLKIIDLDMIDEVVTFTNINIDQLRERHEYARERDCKDTTRSEFMAYLGLLYLLGIRKAHYANVTEIWSNDGTGIEICRAVMSYKRFLFLTRCLRFDDRTTRAERRKIDKLAAVRAFLDSFVKNIGACFKLSERTTVGEMLHPFKGRCNWLQYLSNKPHKYGIKMYALCDAKNFYTSNIEIYCGKQPDGPYASSNSPPDVVKRLVVPIEDSNRNLTTDDYYTGIPLADYLLRKRIASVGALKKNIKEIPSKFLAHKNKDVQSSLFGFQKNKTLTSYVTHKNKAIVLLSTLHRTEAVNSATKKPEIVAYYDATKGGVDTVNRMCATYSVSRITRNWPCVIFYSLMNIAGINAQVLYFFAKPSNSPKCRKVFLKNLSLGLMREHLNARAHLKNLPSDINVFLKANYEQPTKPTDAEQPSTKRGACRLCKMRKKKTSATMKCDNCRSFTCKCHSLTKILCFECRETNLNSCADLKKIKLL